jgi:F0F1-type ATP synthase membrane subunit b/b'
MEIVEVIFWSAIAFALISTLVVMVVVRRSIDKAKEREDLIETIEEVVMNQDKVLAKYRELLD